MQNSPWFYSSVLLLSLLRWSRAIYILIVVRTGTTSGFVVTQRQVFLNQVPYIVIIRTVQRQSTEMLNC